MIENLYQFRESLKQDGVVLNFMGPLSQDLIEDIVGTVREKLKMEGVDMPTIMNVFAVAVEQSQNMIRHSRELVPEGHANTPFRLGTLLIGYEENAYFVLSGKAIYVISPAQEKEERNKMQYYPPAYFFMIIE